MPTSTKNTFYVNPYVKLRVISLCSFLLFAAFSTAAVSEILPGQNVGRLIVEKDGGESFELGHRDKPYVLAFFVPAGDVNADQLKALAELMKREEFSGFDTFVITRGNDEKEKARARDFLSKEGLDFTLLFDLESAVAKKFENKVFPTMYVVNKDGVLSAIAFNGVTEQARKLSFEDFLTYVLDGKEIPFIDFLPYPPEPHRSKTAHALLGKPAPDFYLADPYGKMHRLSSLKGKKNVVVIFWSTTCPHCLRELPKLQNYYLANKMEYDFEVLALTTVKGNKAISDLKHLIRKKNFFTFPVLIDSENISDQYGIKYVPTTFLVNKEGIIVDYLAGGSRYFEPIYDSIFSDPARLGAQPVSEREE